MPAESELEILTYSDFGVGIRWLAQQIVDDEWIPDAILGVVRAPDGRTFVLADLPGLLEGAHLGTGLGHDFLRHIARTRVLIHLLDLGSDRDPLLDLTTVNEELRLYDPALSRRPMLVALNKIDLPESRERVPAVAARVEALGLRVWAISGATGEGIEDLMRAAADTLDQERTASAAGRTSAS